jgi:hypothetical protein
MYWSIESGVFTAFLLFAGYHAGTLLRTKQAGSIRELSVALILVLLVYGASGRRAGQPEEVDSLPEEFVFITGLIKQPNESEGAGGKIWVILRLKDRPEIPQTLELPYSKSLASDVSKLSRLARIKDIEIPVTVKKKPKSKGGSETTLSQQDV